MAYRYRHGGGSYGENGVSISARRRNGNGGKGSGGVALAKKQLCINGISMAARQSA